MNSVSFLRFYLGYLLFTIGGWVYFGYLVYYTNYITTENCNSYTKELSDVIKIFVGISMSINSMNIWSTTCSMTNSYNKLDFGSVFGSVTMSILFLTISSINSLVIFGITSGMTDIQCLDKNAEFGLKISVYGVIWIVFVEILVILSKIILFLGEVVVNAKLHLLCIPCFNACKKYKERRIGIEPSSMPKYNTHHVSIPMPVATFKEEPKLLCSICFDSEVTILLEPCNHICICQLCYNSLVKKECPICKTETLATRKVYFANASPIPSLGPGPGEAQVI
jgi:hypothetical protein